MSFSRWVNIYIKCVHADHGILFSAKAEIYHEVIKIYSGNLTAYHYVKEPNMYNPVTVWFHLYRRENYEKKSYLLEGINRQNAEIYAIKICYLCYFILIRASRAFKPRSQMNLFANCGLWMVVKHPWVIVTSSPFCSTAWITEKLSMWKCEQWESYHFYC